MQPIRLSPSYRAVRIILGLLALLSFNTLASAQEVFVAPTRNSIIASSEQSSGPVSAHLLYVSNQSTVPIVVFGILLTSCENVKQMCVGQRVNVPIPAGIRRQVGRVDVKDDNRAFNYRWSFSYRADSSDAIAMAVLREHGYSVDLVPTAPPAPPVARRTPPDTSSPPGIEQPLSRERLTPEERGIRPNAIAYERRDSTPPPTFRFKVAYGSILGSTMMPGAPIQLTGPCIDPAASTAYEKDAKITRTPWRPPVLPMAFSFMPLPLSLKDSALTSKDVLIRFAVDTTGEAIPMSASVLESPHGTLSVNACQTAIAAKATAARDKAGHAIRAWVQMPVRVGR
jgi:hypothetical protein